jgi:hypothetical protein
VRMFRNNTLAAIEARLSALENGVGDDLVAHSSRMDQIDANLTHVDAGLETKMELLLSRIVTLEAASALHMDLIDGPAAEATQRRIRALEASVVNINRVINLNVDAANDTDDRLEQLEAAVAMLVRGPRAPSPIAQKRAATIARRKAAAAASGRSYADARLEEERRARVARARHRASRLNAEAQQQKAAA